MSVRLARWQACVVVLAVLFALVTPLLLLLVGLGFLGSSRHVKPGESASRELVLPESQELGRTFSTPHDPAVFQLTSARVLGDGRIVRLQWEAGVSVGQSACNRLASTGFPDDEPGINAGAALTVNGMTAECIGTHSEDQNRPQSWIEGFVSGGSPGLPTGHYLFQVVLVDPSGNEKVTHHFHCHGNSTSGVTLQGVKNDTPNAKVTLYWREPCPVGWSVRIYSTNNPNFGTTTLKVKDMTVVATVPYANLDPATSTTPAGTSYTLQGLGTGGASISYASTTWWQDWLLPSPIPFGAPVTISAPASLIQDELSNATEVIASNVATGRSATFTPINDSVVNTDGWIAVPDNAGSGNAKAPYGTLTFANTVYVSYSRGVDATGSPNDITKPYKTAHKALKAFNSTYTNINVRFLRGDTWPVGDFWTVSHWGTSRATPFCIDSYWNPTYGSDPSTRPVIGLMHDYWDIPDSQTVGTTFWQGEVGISTPKDRQAYTVVRGITFLADTAYSSQVWSGMPTQSTSDHQIISDCEFTNFAIIPHNGAEYRPPTGGMVHRTQVHNANAGTLDCGLVPQGAGLGTVTLVDRMAHPFIGNGGSYGIHAGDTSIRILGSAPNWNLRNWLVDVTDGTHATETKTITSGFQGTGGGSNSYSVDAPFLYTYSWLNTRTTVSLRPPNGTQFKIYMGTGSDAGATTYTISGYNASTKTANVAPKLPAVAATTRIAWQPDADNGNHASGMFTDNVSDYLLSQCTFDQCGWSRPDNSKRWNNALSHGVYLSYQALKICIWGSWFTNNSSYGVMQRGGGTSAYNVFALNTHVSYQGATSGTFRKILAVQNGIYQLSSSATYDNIPNHYCFDSNIIMSSTGKNEVGIANFNASGRDSLALGVGPTTDADHSETAPKHLRARHNTFIDAGGMDLVGSPPNPGTFEYTHNLVANRPVTGLDYQGNPYRILAVQPLPGWTTNGPFTVPDNDAWATIDKNAYWLGVSGPTAFAWRSKKYGSMAAYQTAGHEPQSISPTTITFANGAYTLDSWAAAKGLGSTSTDLRAALNARPGGTWAEGYDAQKCYQAFQAAYTPDATNVPALDGSPLGYYGASDNRPGRVSASPAGRSEGP